MVIGDCVKKRAGPQSLSARDAKNENIFHVPFLAVKWNRQIKKVFKKRLHSQDDSKIRKYCLENIRPKNRQIAFKICSKYAALVVFCT